MTIAELTLAQLIGLSGLGMTPFALLAAMVVQARNHRARWRALVGRLQLTNVQEYRRLGFVMRVDGERAGFLVRIIEARGREPGPPIRIVADSQDRIPRTIRLRREDARTAIAERLGRKEIETGDKAFDEAVFACGPELALQAALDPVTRALICSLLLARGDVANGAVELPLWTEISNVTAIATALDAVLTVGQRLTDPEDLASRLCERFRDETSPDVRVRLLGLLADRFPAEAEARAIFREALLADSDDLRLRAARVLGDEAREALLAIAAHPEGDNSQAARAIELLGRRLPLDRTLDILTDALRAGRRGVARAAVEVLGQHGGTTAVKRLGVVLAVAHVDLAVAAARALAATGDADAEAPLLGALASAQADVGVAICEALGVVGSSAAVATLRATAENASTAPATARAAIRAIQTIHARLRGAAPGQVSLTDGESGQLTLADEAVGGRLSLTRAASDNT